MKNSIKKLLGIIIIIILTATCTVVAQTLIKSSEVTYDNSKSKGSFNNVQKSLDELYQKAGYTGEEYHEDILHGADPVLSGELIPVYLADNGDVYYANTHTKWYEYATKRWANAVILVDDAYAKNREDKKDKYSVGDKISEEDIESYFVWIPRYAYKLWNLGTQEEVIDSKTMVKDNGIQISSLFNTRIIDIEFGTKSYLDNLGYKSLIRNSETGAFTDPPGLAVNDYLIHPAFTLGNTELNGLWVAKFEVGYNQTNAGETAITGTDKWVTNKAGLAIDSSKIIIKPNVFSLRNTNIYYMFNFSKEYKTDLKSHMLKNTEWGAVTYLSHSKYGKGAEINLNNASDYKTGYSAAPNTDQTQYSAESGSSTSGLSEAYNTPIGYLASTTGNITGIYDMAGGNLEYVSATIINSGESFPGDYSGFNPDEITQEMKAGYIDAYPSDITSTSYNKRILGDATGELAPFYYYDSNSGVKGVCSSWYHDEASMLSSGNPWFHRGGYFDQGTSAGIFKFYNFIGSAGDNLGFRLALAI